MSIDNNPTGASLLVTRESIELRDGDDAFGYRVFRIIGVLELLWRIPLTACER